MSDGFRIAPELFERTLGSTTHSEALHQLDRWWCARPGRSAEQQFFGLSRVEFDVHLYLLYLGEVGNGGHSQFFLNPTGGHASETLDSLDRLGLAKLHAILSQGIETRFLCERGAERAARREEGAIVGREGSHRENPPP